MNIPAERFLVSALCRKSFYNSFLKIDGSNLRLLYVEVKSVGNFLCYFRNEVSRSLFVNAVDACVCTRVPSVCTHTARLLPCKAVDRLTSWNGTSEGRLRVCQARRRRGGASFGTGPRRLRRPVTTGWLAPLLRTVLTPFYIHVV